MYNVKQTQSEINDLKEKLSIQQQKNQLQQVNLRQLNLWILIVRLINPFEY